MTGPVLHAMYTGDPVAMALFTALVVIVVAILATNVAEWYGTHHR